METDAEAVDAPRHSALIESTGSEAGRFPLSLQQRRLWHLDPQGAWCRVQARFEVAGDLEPRILQAAVQRVVDRHEILRTTFERQEWMRVPQQVVHLRLEPGWRSEDLTGLGEGERALRCEQLLTAESTRTLDLARGPLLWVLHLALSGTDHVVSLCLPSLCADPWALGDLTVEIGKTYATLVAGGHLAGEPMQYVDFAQWQDELARSGELQEERELARAFWASQGPEALSRIVLPLESQGGERSRRRIETEAVLIGEEMDVVLRKVAQRLGTPAADLLLAGWFTYLCRLTGRTDLAVGVILDGRGFADLQDGLGPYACCMPVRARLADDPTFSELLRRIRLGTETAARWQEYGPGGWTEIEEKGSPPFACTFQFIERPGGYSTGGWRISLVRCGGTVEPCKVMLSCTGPPLAAELRYDAGLFAPGEAARMGQQLCAVLGQIADHAEKRISTFDVLSPGERRMLIEFHASAPERACAGSFLQLFKEQAGSVPERVAVIAGEVALTYGELDVGTDRLARRLRARGIGPEGRVAIYAGRSPQMVIGMLGVLKAGGAYVPLDPAFPPARMTAILEESGAALLLVEPGLAAERPAYDAGRTMLLTAHGDAAEVSAGQPEAAAESVPEGLMYLLFTSGSTGRPKGVGVEHRQLCNYLHAILERLDLPPEGPIHFAVLSTFAADLGNTMIFPALATGGCLHLLSMEQASDPEALAQYFSLRPIDCLKIVPSHLAALLTITQPQRILPRRRLVLGGEAASPALVERLHSLAPAELVTLNHYGPTETTVGVTTHRLDVAGHAGRTPPLGRPLANVSLHLLDDWLQPVPQGVVGEIYIGGANVARGYLGHSEATAEKFIPDPFSAAPGDRLYRTGDRARFDDHGELEILGRVDQQVKIRGFRVELGEIESVLREHPGVREAVVLAREDRPKDGPLTAYLIPVDGRVTREALRGFLAERLPEYMVPAAFLWLDTLPLTPNGKVDRRALSSAREQTSDRAQEATAPRNPFEELLAGIWSEVLRVEGLGVEDNFFDLGGHSLLATRVISRVREAFGVTLPVRSLFDHPTVSRLAEAVVEALQRGEAPAPPLEATPRVGPLPLSFAQQRLWFLDQLEPGSSAYNLPHGVVLTGALHLPTLASAVGEIVRRHEALRTTFELVDGEPVARIGEAERLALPVVDLRALGAGSRKEARRLARYEARRPFDLQRGPLLRLLVVQLSEASHALLSTMHHIISDGWSTGILVRELSVLYGSLLAGRESPLPELPIQYGDFAVWQRRWLSGEVLARQLAYWKDQLSGVPPALEVPTDRARPPVRRGRGAREPFVVPGELLERLRALVREQGATLFMGLLTGFTALLGRYTGQEDLVVGTPIAGRTRVEVEGLIGFFVNTLVLRADLSGAPPFVEQLRRLREVSLGAYAHQEVPFEQLVEELGPVRDLSRAPLFQAMFVLQNVPREALAVEGLGVEGLELDSDVSKFDLTLSMVERGGVLRGSLEYDMDLFDRATVCRFAEHLHTLLSGALVAPDTALSALSMQTSAERHHLLTEYNDSAARLAGESCVHRWIEHQSSLSPDAVAVVCEGWALSYGELDARSNRLGRHLRRLGVGPEDVVGICLQRSVELLVGLLGILKAGGAYLPLDPALPPERLTFMLEDGLKGLSEPVLLVERQFVSIFTKWIRRRDARPVELASIWNMWRESGEALEGGASSENLAYVIYTSGSTGKPKGVQIRHGALANFLSSMRETTGIASSDALLGVATLSFDMAVFELYLPLVSGACLVLAPREVAADGEQLLDRLVDLDITMLQTTPATWRLLFGAGWNGKRRLKAVCGGEALPCDLADQLLAATSALWNGYGPTEATVVSTLQPVHEGEQITIGRPLANTAVYLLSRQLTPVALGVPGELYIGGAGVARGYRDRPELTAERFIPDSFTGMPGARLYKTGDLARWLPEGRLDFSGRGDFQIKIRGFRVELGEIESVLCEHPGVREAVVLAREDRPGDKRLIAYLAPVDGRLPRETLRGFLKERLPEYMVPAAFLWLDALPLTPNGKVDRRALAASSGGSEDSEIAFGPARDALELDLIALWQEVLERQPIGVREDFFELGGHSLLAVRLVALLRERLRCDLPLTALFQRGTVERLASLLRSDLQVASRSPLVTLCPGGDLPPFFCVAPAHGALLCYQRLVEHLGPAHPFHGFQAKGRDSDDDPHTRIEDMAGHYLDALRRFRPRGPYHLGGWSLGSAVAFEMARKLRAGGEEVALLALIDPPAPRLAPKAEESDLDEIEMLRFFASESGLEVEAEELRALGEEERLIHVVTQAIERGLMPADTGLQFGVDYLRRWLKVMRAGRLASDRYVPGPYSGPLTIFSATETIDGGPRPPDAGGWSRISSGPIAVHPLPGNHNTILHEPHVRVLAELLHRLIAGGA